MAKTSLALKVFENIGQVLVSLKSVRSFCIDLYIYNNVTSGVKYTFCLARDNI